MKRALFALLLVAGCGGKEPVVEDFSDLAGADEKSDKFSSRFALMGSLWYGQSRVHEYRNPPRYAAFKFSGRKGDAVTIDVKSGRDAVAFLLDNYYNIVGYSDDDMDHDTLDSRIVVTLRATGTHYLVFREYQLRTTSMTVSLTGGGGGCSYNGNSYALGATFPSTDGCNTCSCGDGGLVGCTKKLCGCSYGGSFHRSGESFPSTDGCNTCTCGSDGNVFCTERACLSCDQPGREYVAHSPADCARVRYFCIATMKSFSDECGCGCEPI